MVIKSKENQRQSILKDGKERENEYGKVRLEEMETRK